MKSVEYIYIVFKILLWGMSIKFKDHCCGLTWREAELETTIAECTEVVYSFILPFVYIDKYGGEMDDEMKWMMIGNLKSLEHEYGNRSSSFKFSNTQKWNLVFFYSI